MSHGMSILMSAIALATMFGLTPSLHAVTPAHHPVTGDPISKTFSVTIDGEPVHVRSYEDYDWINIPWTGPVTVAVTRLDGEAVSAHRIRPTRLNIPGTASGDTLRFRMSAATYLVININKLRKLIIVPQRPDPDRPDLSSDRVVNVRSLSADATGTKDNTDMLQKAINELPRDGTLYFPRGVYRAGSLHLKSNMTLYLDDNAVLKGVDNPDRHQFHSSYLYFLKMEDVENVRIAGHGMIDANGDKVRKAWQDRKKVRKVAGRAFLAINAKRLTVKDITVRDSYSWNVHFVNCDDLHVDRIKVFSNMSHSNGDGLDIDGCVDVLVENSLILAEDDAITPKAAWSPRRSPRNYVVRDCVLWSQDATGIRLGAETGSPEFSDMLFENLDILRANTMIRIYNYDGADVHDIVFRNIWIEEYSLDVQDQGYDEILRHPAVKAGPGSTYMFYAYVHPRRETSPIGLIRDVVLENIHAPRVVKSRLSGPPRADGSSSVRNIIFRNCTAAGQPMSTAKALSISAVGSAEPAVVERK